MIEQGEIYLADLFAGGRRPVLVVSRDALNRGRYVVIVPLTTSRFEQRRRLGNCVAFRRGEFGLGDDCVAQCEAISGIEVERLDQDEGPPVGRLDPLTLRAVILAIGNVIEAECEPV